MARVLAEAETRVFDDPPDEVVDAGPPAQEVVSAAEEASWREREATAFALWEQEYASTDGMLARVVRSRADAARCTGSELRTMAEFSFQRAQQALETGAITERMATVLWEETRDLSIAHTARIERECLEAATSCTPASFGRRIRTRVEALDPGCHTGRRNTGTRTRRRTALLRTTMPGGRASAEWMPSVAVSCVQKREMTT